MPSPLWGGVRCALELRDFANVPEDPVVMILSRLGGGVKPLGVPCRYPQSSLPLPPFHPRPIGGIAQYTQSAKTRNAVAVISFSRPRRLLLACAMPSPQAPGELISVNADDFASRQ